VIKGPIKMKKIIILISILFLSINCSDKPTDIKPVIESEIALDQLNNLLLNQLDKKRIVMFGDAWHGHGYYFRRVIDFINYWLDSIEHNLDTLNHTDSTFTKLVLFLEIKEIVQNLIYDYIESGDIQPLLINRIESTINYGGWRLLTVDEIEFLYNLREIHRRITILNRQNSEKKIEFQIRGAENYPSYLDKANDLTFMNSEFRFVKFNWFAKERDKLSSGNIITFLENNPDYKALVFYGTAHLLRGEREKRDPELRESIKSYYLAQYLDNHFGRNNISIFHTYNYFKEKTNYINRIKTEKNFPDFYVYCEPIPYSPFPLTFIKTRNIIKIFHELLKKHSEDNDENDRNYGLSFSKNFLRYIMTSYLYLDPKYKEQFDSLYTIFNTNQDNQAGLKKLILIGNNILNNFDAFENVNKTDKWMILQDFMEDRYFSFQLHNIIKNFPSKYINSEPDSVVDLEEIFNENTATIKKSLDQDIIKLKPELVEYFMIKLLWIATTEEKQKALKYLKQSTHLYYNTAKEWNTYWRNKIREDISM
jgi:hypothetical protein